MTLKRIKGNDGNEYVEVEALQAMKRVFEDLWAGKQDYFPNPPSTLMELSFPVSRDNSVVIRFKMQPTLTEVVRAAEHLSHYADMADDTRQRIRPLEEVLSILADNVEAALAEAKKMTPEEKFGIDDQK